MNKQQSVTATEKVPSPYADVTALLSASFYLTKTEADKYAQNRLAGQVTPELALQRLKSALKSLGFRLAPKLVKKHPLALQLPLELLPDVLSSLRLSMLPSDALYTATHFPYVVLCTCSALEDTSRLLRSKLHTQGLYVGFAKFRPEIFLLPPKVLEERIRGTIWTGDHDDFWSQIMNLPRDMTNPRIRRSVVAEQIMSHAKESGLSSYAADRFAQRMARIFDDEAYKIYLMLAAKGWAPFEILELDRKTHHWRDKPAQILRTEDALITAGLSQRTARKLIIQRPIFVMAPSKTTCAIVAFFKARGLEDDTIFQVSVFKPGLFTGSLAKARAAYTSAQMQKSGLLYNTCKSVMANADS